ncbi:hypothetical protein ES707_22050 [subsurface metagenome]
MVFRLSLPLYKIKTKTKKERERRFRYIVTVTSLLQGRYSCSRPSSSSFLKQLLISFITSRQQFFDNTLMVILKYRFGWNIPVLGLLGQVAY